MSRLVFISTSLGGTIVTRSRELQGCLAGLAHPGCLASAGPAARPQPRCRCRYPLGMRACSAPAPRPASRVSPAGAEIPRPDPNKSSRAGQGQTGLTGSSVNRAAHCGSSVAAPDTSRQKRHCRPATAPQLLQPAISNNSKLRSTETVGG